MNSDDKPSNHPPVVWAEDSRAFLVLPFVPPNAALDDLGNVHQKLQSISLGQLARALDASLGEADVEALKKSGDDRVWTPDEFTLSKDYFHDFVGTVFGNEATRNHEGSSRAFSMKPLSLSQAGVNLLNGGIKSGAKGLAIRARNQSVKRLNKAGVAIEEFQRGSDTWLRFELESVQCLFFGTGIGMLLLEVSYHYAKGKSKPVPLEIIQEINFDLCRARYWSGRDSIARIAREHELPLSDEALRRRELEAKVRKLPPLKATEAHWEASGIGQIALHLIGESQVQQSPPTSITPIHWEKAAIFCGVRLDRELEDSERTLLITRLSRKETSDYQPLAEATRSGIYRPFQQISHAASIEGGAILVETSATGQQVEHIRSFISNSMQQAYLPLMLWAMHEYLFLTELMKSTNGVIDFSRPSGELAEKLQDFRARIYNYRFHFRFSHASAVSMHNDMFRLWRDVFELKKILEEVNTDVGEADSKYEEIQREAKQEIDKRNQRRLSIIIFSAGLLISIPDWIDKKFYQIMPFLCDESCGGTWARLCGEVSLHYALITLFVAALILWMIPFGKKALDWLINL